MAGRFEGKVALITGAASGIGAATARRLAAELFDAPDTVITQLGLHPFQEEGTLFFAYEGSETVWEAANKGIACITVRDILEYGRVLLDVRRGE